MTRAAEKCFVCGKPVNFNLNMGGCYVGKKPHCSAAHARKTLGEPMYIIDSWTGCYPSSWKGKIIPDAITHPAKFSSKLIQRIYEHIQEEGWLKPGDLVIDPFGGVALGAFDAMAKGLRWRGIELEARFAELGNKNIDLWNSQFHRMPRWSVDAVLLQGDSRRLIEVLREADTLNTEVGASGSVSSPPYSEGLGHGMKQARDIDIKKGLTSQAQAHYGETPGQLGEMSTGDFNAALSSPPYAESLGNADKSGIDWSKQQDRETDHPHGWNGESYSAAGAVSSPPYSEARIGQESGQEQAGHHDQYGPTNGQLGSMKANGFDAALASPPYRQASGGVPEPKPGGPIADRGLQERHAAGNASAHGYGETEGQLANMGEGDFDGALFSPPYGGMPVEKSSKSIDYAKQYEVYRVSGGGQTFEAFVHTQELHSQDYGNSEGQLSHMPTDDFDGAVTSPPFEKTEGAFASRKFSNPEQMAEEMEAKYKDGTFKGHAASKEAILHQLEKANQQNYGQTDGNIGNDSGDDFWMAARQIVDQIYQVLKPGAHAVWVVKGFVKGGKLVDFPGQWRQLCEAAGFETVHEHHAMLVHHHGTSHTLVGGTVEHTTESKSFFRRNAENKTKAAKHWKEVDKKDQDRYLAEAYTLKWTAHEELKAKRPNIKPPSDNIILAKAQMLAWRDSGSPNLEISTSIDWETVLCMMKRA